MCCQSATKRSRQRIEGGVGAIGEIDGPESLHRPGTGINQLGKWSVQVDEKYRCPENQRIIRELRLKCSIHRIDKLLGRDLGALSLHGRSQRDVGEIDHHEISRPGFPKCDDSRLNIDDGDLGLDALREIIGPYPNHEKVAGRGPGRP